MVTARLDRLSPLDLAREAAETVEALARTTSPETHPYSTPCDVYLVFADLARLLAALPQAVTQAQAWLDEQARTGRVGHDVFAAADGGPDPCLDRIAGAAHHTARYLSWALHELDAAREAASHLTHLPPECPSRPVTAPLPGAAKE